MPDSTTPHFGVPDYETLAGRFRPHFQDIATQAVHREHNRESPQAALGALLQAGFGALRVPQAQGGAGATLTQLFHLLIELGEADSNFVQILRAHFGFVESLFDHPDQDIKNLWFQRVAQGALVGAAMSERSSVGDIQVALTPEDGHWHINGEKFYSTGTLYADWIHIIAVEGEDYVSVALPTTAAGVTLADDWNGFGQRLTASGTTRFENALVESSDILRRQPIKPYRGYHYLLAFYQQVHLATIAGIGRATLRDAVTYVQGRTRSFFVPGETRPRENPLVQRVIGRISSLSFVLDSIVSSVSAALDAASATLQSGANDEAIFLQAELAAYKGQQVAIDLILQATGLLFDVGGASALDADRHLDRHWRNARTLASHNPAILRERVLGDYHLNGTNPRAAAEDKPAP